MDSKTKKLVIVITPIFLALFGFIAYQVLNVGNENKSGEKQNKEQKAFVDPGVDTSNRDVSKMSAYEKMEQKLRDNKELKKRKDNKSFYGSFMGGKKDSTDKAEKEKQSKTKKQTKGYDYYDKLQGKEKNKQKKKKTRNVRNPVDKEKKDEKSVIEKRKEKYSAEHRGKEPEKKSDDKKKAEQKNENKDQGKYGGLGVYETNNKDQEKVIDDFVSARFEKNMTLKNGKEVVLVNQKPFNLDGTLINKFALFYGMVNFKNNRFHININTIKNTDNKVYRVNMKVFNTSYQEGLYYDNPEGKETAENATNRSARNVSSGVKESLVKNAVQALTRSNEKDIPKKQIKEGGKVYVNTKN